MTIFSSISVAGLQDLVARMQNSLSAVNDFTGHTIGRSVRADMDELEVSSSGFEALDRVQDWIDDEALPELRRRLNLARALENQQPGAPTVQLDEALVERMSTSTAETRGRTLATQLEELGGINEGFDEIMAEVEELAGDPDAMSAFYAELGPEAAAKFAAALGLPDSGAGENAQHYLQVMSQGLATALLDTDPPDGLAQMYEFHRPTDDPMVAWGRLALLQYGNFTASRPFVEGTVNGTALDAFSADDWADPANISAQSLTGSEVTVIGLPSDIAALAFQTLTHDPELATTVLTGQDISAKELTHRVYAAAGDPAQRGELANSFGLAIEAGTGSTGDPPNTEHTPEQAALAFEFITGSADHDEVPPTIKDTTARIAAAYVDEMLAGAHIDGGELYGDRGSSMTAAPNDFPQGTGLDPSFFLSPRAVHRFLGGFQDTIESSMPFDEAMGRYMDEQLGAAIRADPAHGGGERYTQLQTLFGSLGALHYEARREFAEDFDAQEQARQQAMSTAISDGLGLVPGLPHLTWWAVQKGINLGLGAWQPQGKEDAVAAEQRQAADMRWYANVQQLIENGVLTPEQLAAAPASLVENGRMRSIEEIFADPDTRQAAYDWVNSVEALDVPADAGEHAWDAGWQGGQSFVGRA
jgi:hypothetical protein